MTQCAKLDLNWLSQDLAEADADYALMMPPGRADELLTPEDAERLRIKLAARYHAWTGRSLSDDLADDLINATEGDHDR